MCDISCTSAHTAPFDFIGRAECIDESGSKVNHTETTTYFAISICVGGKSCKVIKVQAEVAASISLPSLHATFHEKWKMCCYIFKISSRNFFPLCLFLVKRRRAALVFNSSLVNSRWPMHACVDFHFNITSVQPGSSFPFLSTHLMIKWLVKLFFCEERFSKVFQFVKQRLAEPCQTDAELNHYWSYYSWFGGKSRRRRLDPKWRGKKM